jgi:ethanolamine utilization protein EutJ
MQIKEATNRRIKEFEAALVLNGSQRPGGPLYAGVDLGTAYIVTAVVDSQGTPVAGMLTRSQSSIRDGLVLDYVGAITILRQQVDGLREAGFPIQEAAAAYPPGIAGRNAQAFGNAVEAVGMELTGLIDEPTAASLVLEIEAGAVVDIGGGTTGISVIQGGEVVYTADEPTGGVHVDLVLSGHFGIEVEEAESIKRDSSRQAELFPLVRAVFQKMGTIVRDHLGGYAVESIYLVGGTSCFTGIEDVIARETGMNVARPRNPLLVTPLGIALDCARRAQE